MAKFSLKLTLLYELSAITRSTAINFGVKLPHSTPVDCLYFQLVGLNASIIGANNPWSWVLETSLDSLQVRLLEPDGSAGSQASSGVRGIRVTSTATATANATATAEPLLALPRIDAICRGTQVSTMGSYLGK